MKISTSFKRIPPVARGGEKNRFAPDKRNRLLRKGKAVARSNRHIVKRVKESKRGQVDVL